MTQCRWEFRLPSTVSFTFRFAHSCCRLTLYLCYDAVPLGIPHSTQQDAELCGYTIPCDAVVICNHQAVHLNETAWNNPCEFDPSRFLDEDCDEPRLLRCISNFIPFGLGSSPHTHLVSLSLLPTVAVG